MAERKRLRATSASTQDGLRDVDMHDDTVLMWGSVAELQRAVQRQNKVYAGVET